MVIAIDSIMPWGIFSDRLLVYQLKWPMTAQYHENRAHPLPPAGLVKKIFCRNGLSQFPSSRPRCSWGLGAWEELHEVKGISVFCKKVEKNSPF